MKLKSFSIIFLIPLKTSLVAAIGFATVTMVPIDAMFLRILGLVFG